MATPLQMRNRAVVSKPADVSQQPTPIPRVPFDAPHRKQALEKAPGLVEAVLAFIENRALHHPEEQMLRMEAKEIKDALASSGPTAYNVGIVRLQSVANLFGVDVGQLITDAQYYINKVQD